MPDDRIPPVKPAFVPDRAVQAGHGAGSRTSDGPVDVRAASVLKPVETANFIDLDVATLSRGLKALLKATATLEDRPRSAYTPSKDELAGFVKRFLKVTGIRAAAAMERSSAAELVRLIESGEASSTVRASKGLMESLKSVFVSTPDGPRYVEVPPGAGLNHFIGALLAGLFPEGRVRLIKVLKRESPGEGHGDGGEGGRGQGEGQGEEGRDGGQGGGHEGRKGPRPGFEHPPGYTRPLTFTSAGVVSGQDEYRTIGVTLEVGQSEDLTECGANIELPPLVVDCAGAAELPVEARFVFEVYGDDDEAEGPVAHAVGTIVINLVRIGIAPDGSQLWGVEQAPGVGPWAEAPGLGGTG